MSKYLPYADLKLDNTVRFEKTLRTKDNSDIRYFSEADVKFTNEVNKISSKFSFVH